ncbi:nucleotidyltransferase family protein [Candidatus Micrarchaeota archaeon]|nr:nucleotidyltransferase family protein [Candidatus Micrarchaeota archaeon]
MKAFVLCGGTGTRLRPYTYTIPKSMLPLGSKPILYYVLKNLKTHGVKDIILSVGYLKEQIMDYFGDGRSMGVKIKYLEEDKPLGTAGALTLFEGNPGSHFFVLMGDQLTNVNLSEMERFHKDKGNIATIALKKRETPMEYGVAEINNEAEIRRFREKPIMEYLINTGIYLFSKEVLPYLEPGKDFAMDVFPKIIKEKKPISGYVFTDYWMDIGRLREYEKTNDLISIIDLVNDLKR